MSEPISKQLVAEWASAGLVLLSGATAGHFAAVGMNLFQWGGAAAAVIGSISVAVAVRVWPAPEKAEAGAKSRD
ncbi:hypothetical protein LRS10_10860 [Phenylobacterium sp. J426]|uniref:hypothetical protein n=1 Tax=Phenylobacterium sp. J426 TaxID=2898439 RepID=UPI002150A998|nr:hypothetical protein [Phenylobacterium sp. J426]MCR5874624.1 hypothetical protein [Phenylobacterium sp. J426]